jgi:hypothetical protein
MPEHIPGEATALVVSLTGELLTRRAEHQEKVT